MNTIKKIVNWFKFISLVNIFFYILIFTLLISILFLLLSRSLQFIPLTYSVEFLPITLPPKDYLVILGFLAAALTLTYNIRRHISEDYYKEAKSQLEKAFLTLSDNANKISNDRLKWLTCARLLLSTDRLGNKIIMSSHKYIYKEDRQYWRVKFSESIQDFPESFYTGRKDGFFDDTPQGVDKIDLDSVLVVHKFMQWDIKYTDPLGRQSLDKVQLRHISACFPILRELIRKDRESN